MTEKCDFDNLYRDHERELLRLALARLDSRFDAEDAVAETFTQAWKRRGEGGHVFTRPWLYSTLRNVICNQYRDRDRVRRRVEAWAAAIPPTDDHRHDEHLCVRAAVRRLSTQDRLIVWMAYWQRLSRAEIAARIGIPSATVRVRLFRARANLETALAHIGRE